MRKSLIYISLTTLLLLSVILPGRVLAQIATYSVPGSSTLTIPTNVSSITVQAWGGGGGGSKGYTGLKGTGGGGGGYASATLNVNPGDVITIVVGAGGTGATSSGNGNDGESSTVSLNANVLTASGGTGGISTSAPSGTGGTGGTGSFSGTWTGQASHCGGYGATLSSPAQASPGGGAGGGAGSTANGKNAGGSTSNCGTFGGSQSGGNATGTGGAGGDGGTTNSNGVNGTNYGGGGGGNAGTGNGGNGAGGYVSITYSTTLPVTIINFKGSLNDNQAVISWTSINEVEIFRYILEVSHDAKSFYPADTVKAVGTSNIQEYNSSLQLTQFSYVRLRIVEVSGSVSLSDIIALGLVTNTISLYPNPVLQGQSLTIETELTGKVTLLNAQGLSVFEQNVLSGRNSVGLESFAAGIYFLELQDSSQQIKRERIIIY